MIRHLIIITLCLAIGRISALAESNDTAARPMDISRSEIEGAFLSRLKSPASACRREYVANTDLAIPYGESMYILPGESYQKEGVITRNAYFRAEDMSPVWDAGFPLESIANLFICPAAGCDSIAAQVTILKHEYGEKETVRLPLGALLGICEEDGCVPFWGVENFSDGEIDGAIFLYNAAKGYDHVIRVHCNFAELFSGNGELVCRASLFIPTTNVHNLFQPDAEINELTK